MEPSQVQPKTAETRVERLILGFLADEAKHVEYGKITLEVTVFKGRITNAQATEVKKSFNLNET